MYPRKPLAGHSKDIPLFDTQLNEEQQATAAARCGSPILLLALKLPRTSYLFFASKFHSRTPPYLPHIWFYPEYSNYKRAYSCKIPVWSTRLHGFQCTVGPSQSQSWLMTPDRTVCGRFQNSCFSSMRSRCLRGGTHSIISPSFIRYSKLCAWTAPYQKIELERTGNLRIRETSIFYRDKNVPPEIGLMRNNGVMRKLQAATSDSAV